MLTFLIHAVAFLIGCGLMVLPAVLWDGAKHTLSPGVGLALHFAGVASLLLGAALITYAI